MSKGYKASYGGKCVSLTYEVGKEYFFDGEIEICHTGFHFCEKLRDVFHYYEVSEDLIIFEVISDKLYWKKLFVHFASKIESPSLTE